jgi:hypothetical protein
MEVTGLKRVSILKTGQKASCSKFVGTTGQNDKKWDNPVLNGTYGHLSLTSSILLKNTYNTYWIDGNLLSTIWDNVCPIKNICN